MEEQLNQILAGLVASVTAAGGLKVLIPKAIAWLDARRERIAIGKHEVNLIHMRQVQAMVSQLRFGLQASRVAIVRVANGGATPRASAPLNVQTIFESSDEPSPTGRIFWLRPRRADGSIIEAVGQLVDNTLLTLDTETMEPGMLRTLAEGVGAERVLLRRVRISSTSSQMLMIFLDDTTDIGPAQRLLLEDISATIADKL
jgi:hypothetical protein